MALIVDNLREQLRLPPAIDGVLLARSLAAATARAERHLRSDFAVDYPAGLPEAIESAILMHAATLFLNPAATATGDGTAMPQGWYDMLESYRNFT